MNQKKNIFLTEIWSIAYFFSRRDRYRTNWNAVAEQGGRYTVRDSAWEVES